MDEMKKMAKIIGENDLYHLAKSYCENQKDYPYGISHKAKNNLAKQIVTYLQQPTEH